MKRDAWPFIFLHFHSFSLFDLLSLSHPKQLITHNDMNKTEIKKWSYRIVVFALLVAGVWILTQEFMGRSGVVTTDNARICRHVMTQSVKVEGFIERVCFDSYTEVKKGDTLIVINDAEYRHALAQAKAHLEQVRNGARQAGESVQTSSQQIGEAEASVVEMETVMERARREEERYKTLLAQKAVTPQQYDDVHAAYLTAKARLDRAVKARQAQTTMKSERNHALSASKAMIEAAEAAVKLAELNLSYCVVTASADGITGSKDVNVGELVHRGQAVVSVVEADEVWVEANYKESQLPHISVGDRARLKVDALPGEVLTGTVERLSGGTGSVFSLLPVDNTAGNFVKVEQRLTVRIKLDKQTAQKLKTLKAGYNVVCEIEK